MPTRFYVWAVFVIVVTLLPRLSNPTWPEILGGMFFNSLLFIVPVYAYTKWSMAIERRGKQVADWFIFYALIVSILIISYAAIIMQASLATLVIFALLVMLVLIAPAYLVARL